MSASERAISCFPETIDRRDVTAWVVRNPEILRGPWPTALDCRSLRRADSSGLALLAWFRRHGTALEGLSEPLEAALRAYAEAEAAVGSGTSPAGRREGPLTALGRTVCGAAAEWGGALAYLGELLCWWAAALVRPRLFRWGDFCTAFFRCGVQALPVVGLIGFLLGLILAFQSAMPLRMFGAEGFVGGLVGIALVRELGLIITAILVTGRSGSAFAAELGTMKVNEELDALGTMGLRPVRFLVLPRVAAGTLALPVLALFATFCGLLGGWFVMGILGFTLSYFVDQLQAFVGVGDLIGSFAKSFVFGFAVSAVGCRCGLTAGRDAGAVGTATTSAVVQGIVLTAVLEGLFAVVFFAMGW